MLTYGRMARKHSELIFVIRQMLTEWAFYFHTCGIIRNEMALSGGFRRNGHCTLIGAESFIHSEEDLVRIGTQSIGMSLSYPADPGGIEIVIELKRIHLNLERNVTESFGMNSRRLTDSSRMSTKSFNAIRMCADSFGMNLRYQFGLKKN